MEFLESTIAFGGNVLFYTYVVIYYGDRIEIEMYNMNEISHSFYICLKFIPMKSWICQWL